MIKKLKPIHARAVIETHRPLGLFYVHENGVYVGNMFPSSSAAPALVSQKMMETCSPAHLFQNHSQ